MIEGYENHDTDLEISAIGRYDSGMENADGAVMEIVDYNKETGYAYAVNGMTGELSVFSLEALEAGKTIQMLDGSTIDVKTLVQVDGFTYGDMTSVAISPMEQPWPLPFRQKDTQTAAAWRSLPVRATAP